MIYSTLKQMILLLSLSGMALATDLNLPPVFTEAELSLIQGDQLKLTQAKLNLKHGVAGVRPCWIAERDYYLRCLRLLKAKDKAIQEENALLMQSCQDRILESDAKLIELLERLEVNGFAAKSEVEKTRIELLALHLKDLHLSEEEAAATRQALDQSCEVYLTQIRKEYENATIPFKDVQAAEAFVAEILGGLASSH
ncbi:MAG: hypothetical protein R3Y56_01975 [Akkermansia sp.]